MHVISKMKEMTLTEDEDRLSNLPDALLITILSLLDAREIVQTCLLSKRWRDLWSFVPCLVFDDGGRLEGRDLKRFQKFVGSFLRLRDDATPLHTFSLSHEPSPQSWSWVHYALSHNPKILGISCFRSNPQTSSSFDLTDRLFTCASIEDLLLGLVRGTELVFDNVFLPKLWKMLFAGVTIDGNNMNKFLSGCPALERLGFAFCKLNADCISIQTVKKLLISNCEFRSELEPSSFSISAPYLEDLGLSNNVGHIKLKDMSKVEMAKITTNSRYNHEYLSSFSVIVDLDIACYSHHDNHQHWLKETLQGELRNCPTFHKLRKLGLRGGCIHCDFDVLTSFLKHCPNLKYLILSHKDGICQVHNTPNDLEVDRAVRLLVKSAMGLDRINITLVGDLINVVM